MKRFGLPLLLAVGCVAEPGPAPCATGAVCLAPNAIALTTTGRTAQILDLDGDGLRDRVTLGGAALTIHRGSDRGDLAPQIHALPDDGVALAFGDLDGDGRLDLVTAVPNLGALAWLRGGDDEPRVIDLGAAIRTLATFDLDRDGALDVIAGERDDDGVHVLLGGADGPVVGQRLVVGQVSGLAVGDLRGDGATVVAVAVPGRGVVELLSVSASGRLARGDVVWRSSFPTAAVLADLDDDGALDLAAIDRLDHTLRVSLGDGDGGFVRHATWPLDLEPTAVVARRGPPGPELAITGSDGVTLALVDPATGAPRISASTRAAPLALQAVDLDGDGVDELAYAESQLREVDGFTATRVWSAVAGVEAGRLVLADLDGDGRRELIAEDRLHHEFVVHTVDGAGLRETTRAPAPAGLDGLRAIDRPGGASALAYWHNDDLAVLVQDDDLTKVATFTAPDGDIVDVAADRDAVYVATNTNLSALGEPTRTGTLWRLPRDGDALRAAEPAFTGGEITSLARDPSGELFIGHAGGVTRRLGEHLRDFSPLRDLRGAAPIDGDLAGCRDDGMFVGYADGRTERLTDAPCTRVDACDLDGDHIPELLAARVLDASAPGLGYITLEIHARADGRWISRGGLTLGLQADRFALDCDDLSVWTGGPLGLAHADLSPGPALRETGPRLAAAPVLLGDVDGDNHDDLLADDGRQLLRARPDGRGYARPIVITRPGDARLVALAELDGAPGRELIARTTDLAGVTTHEVWSLQGDEARRTGALAIADWEVLGDFDGDGRDELIVRSAPATRALLRPDIHGLSPVLALPPALAEFPELRPADLDSDGRTDLLALRDGDPSPALFVVRSLGPAGFAEPQAWPLTASLANLAQLSVGDVDQDGALDLVFIDIYAPGVAVCPGDGHGGPATRCHTVAWTAEDFIPGPPIVADFDGDALPDLVISRRDFGRPSLQLLRGDGLGGLVVDPPIPVPVAGLLRRARVGDGALVWLVLTANEALQLGAEAP